VRDLQFLGLGELRGIRVVVRLHFLVVRLRNLRQQIRLEQFLDRNLPARILAPSFSVKP